MVREHIPMTSAKPYVETCPPDVFNELAKKCGDNEFGFWRRYVEIDWKSSEGTTTVPIFGFTVHVSDQDQSCHRILIGKLDRDFQIWGNQILVEWIQSPGGQFESACSIVQVASNPGHFELGDTDRYGIEIDTLQSIYTGLQELDTQIWYGIYHKMIDPQEAMKLIDSWLGNSYNYFETW